MRNITLIGMPTAGKSTIGVILAKVLGYRFIDSDLVIQEKYKKLLPDIIEEYGYDGFIKIEEEVNASFDLNQYIIATGGSVVYGEKAMQHLKEISTVIYLQLSLPTIKDRLGNLKRRGVVLKEGQDLKGLYDERTLLYEKYADIIVDAEGLEVEELMDKIAELVS